MEEDRLKLLRKPNDIPRSQERSAYQAFSLATEPRRYLEIRSKFPTPTECPAYGMITNIRYEPLWGLAVTIRFGSAMVVQIEGKNLLPLVSALKEWKLEWLSEFDPEWHLEPTDTSLPYIERIEIATNRPELPTSGVILH